MPVYKIDAAHTAAEFSARHMMVTTVRGSFKTVNGTLSYNPENPALSSVEAVIDTNSMSSTGVQQRDDHLRSPDFLDVVKYPTITFKSTKVEPYDNNTRAKVTGDLTIRDVTRSVVLDAEFLGETKGFQGEPHIGFTGSVKVNREDFGLNWNMALEAGGWLVGKEVSITLDVEAVGETVGQPA
ncbi:MAG: YceI family protein [Anaerolineae bacterium]|nr:YceI family protein [Anaerolineae bacterium]